MSDFDIARIVPSTRDLHMALSTHKRTLSMACDLGEAPHASEAQRLDGLDVRALASAQVGVAMRDAATATASLPMLSLAPTLAAADAQRARFFGADGVAVPLAGLDDRQLQGVVDGVRSMRMMPLLLATDGSELSRAAALKARAVLWRGSQSALLAELAALPKQLLVVAWLEEASEDAMKQLLGKVDAAVVGASVHAAARFDALLDAVDG